MEPSTPVKMMIGMILTGLSFVILYFAANSGGFNKPVFEVVQATPTETWVAISPEARGHLGITAPPVKVGDRDAWRVTPVGGAAVKPGDFVGFEGQTGEQITVAPAHRVSAWWLISAYFVLTLGELMLSPMGLSLVSKVAPIRMRGLMMGGWFAATAIGNKLTGVAGYWDLWSHSYFFILLASMALGMAVVLLLLLRPLKKAMPGV
jgi:dipeptide/tripeptide permease